MKYFEYDYQAFCTLHILKHRGTGLFLEMGLGKTVATLTALNQLKQAGQISKILVVAPLKVATDTWPDELAKWDHLNGLTYSKVLGTAARRKKALAVKADIYLINPENIPWLIGLNHWAFDTVVIDELSKFKSPKSKRFKAIRIILPKVKKIIGLTGTPMPNSLIDLWSQLYILDSGERLGKSIGEYRNKYFIADKSNGHIVYSYKIKAEKNPLLGVDINSRIIYDKISDICVSMKEKDYLKLPEKIIRTREISLSPEIYKRYREFEKELVLDIVNRDQPITAANAAVLTGKLLQFSNGAVYDENKAWHPIHDEKLEALQDIIEDAQGAPVLVFYSYKHDAARIKAKIKGVREMAGSKDIKDWNSGRVAVMLAHPASAGHGLNLQAGGNIIVWFGLQWSLELYLQANARLHRQGQLKPVIIHHLICKGTMDREVMQALTNKQYGQDGLMEAVKARIKKYLLT